ncbi:rhomboid family intramembrane serine protease [Flavobacterium terrigena]|uniref:Rhomboid protease GluP n=1 Tax=Flavobacterium terrigena TaxID=402734 RepID=A0A1H6UTP6_9FLAO|nr:rhomboid family intramembrane serine protease [Flavobacterium terrigena]SEI91435.1 rhomboid protease GluP [Flavobacterium terrigena]
MAVGFTPKHLENISLNDLSQQQFLALANETATKIDWNVNYISDNGLIAYTDNGMFSWNAEIKIKIENGIATINSESTGSEMVDWGKNKKNVTNFINHLEKLKPTITKEELDIKYQELKEQLVPQEEDILKLPPATKTEQITDFFSIFKPTQDYFVTPILLDLNIIIFILMVISGVNIMQPDNESLLNWGANFRPLTLEGEWWRIITNCFLHIGVFHLLMNMYALLYIGVLLEPLLGRTRYISAYLLTGITASIASLWWNDFTISAGASGAIFGMYGVFLALLTTDLVEKATRKTLLTSIAIFVGFNLINGLKGGIDNAAHIGGLLGGFVIGYTLIPSLKKPKENKLKFGTIGLLSILILTSSFAVYKKIPNDIGTYDAQMKEFVSIESMALEFYNLPPNTPNDKLLYSIKDVGIYYWNENIKLIDSFKELDLPLEIRKRNLILKEYCELRIKSYELLYKAVLEDTDKYNSQIENYGIQINAKMKELESQQQSQ